MWKLYLPHKSTWLPLPVDGRKIYVFYDTFVHCRLDS